MTDPHPVVERYLSRLTAGLGEMAPAERKDIASEIKNHVAEALAAGTSLDAVLEALGPAEDLARAYRVEALVNPPPAARGTSRLERFLKITGLVVIGSIPTIVIVAVLGAIGASFIFAGVAVFVAGVLAAANGLPPWVSMDVPPVIAILLGPCMVVTGVVAVAGLVYYIKLLARAVRAVLPKAT